MSARKKPSNQAELPRMRYVRRLMGRKIPILHYPEDRAVDRVEADGHLLEVWPSHGWIGTRSASTAHRHMCRATCSTWHGSGGITAWSWACDAHHAEDGGLQGMAGN